MTRLLLVDDDADQLVVWRLVLASSGYQVDTALNAADACARVSQAPPEIVLMDLGLPEMQDGLGLIRALKDEPRFGGKIIVLSGWPEAFYDRPEAEKVDDILAKPILASELLRAVRALLPLVWAILLGLGVCYAQEFPFKVAAAAEVVAEVEMSSPRSDWSQPGREAALANLTVDGAATQHVMLFAGEERHTYAAFLGKLAEGPHNLRIDRNGTYSAAGAGLKVWKARFRDVPLQSAEGTALAHAPILYARADTVGGFTDVPLVAYCERKTENGRPLLQYTTVFSNEDGGTSTRALMARWGRTTDVEYVYRAWLDPAGHVERATIQAKDHVETEFTDRREGTHPVLIPCTLNNMVCMEGTSAVRYQLPPVVLDLTADARERVMDEHPVTYRVMAQELARERKLRAFGTVEGEKISDPRHYLYVEMKVANRQSAVAALVRLRDEPLWRSSHLGRRDYAIERDGWVRTTIELPPGTTPVQIAEFGFECLVPPAKQEHVAGTCRVEAVSKTFFLGGDYKPRPAIWHMREPFELPSGLIRVFPARAPAQDRP